MRQKNKIMMPGKDKIEVIKRYSKRFKEFGCSPKTLGWDKGKQDLRYSILFGEFDLENKSILDIGCGFGDANKYLKNKVKNYKYVGVDIVEDLITSANKQYQGKKNIKFIVADFLEKTFEDEFDIVVASGVFNFKLSDGDNYDFINDFLKKAFAMAKDGLAFDFLSDQVDFQYEHTFHSNPLKILDMAYFHTRNVALKNDYMPFEFSIFMFKNQSFEVADTIFTRFKNERNYYRFD